MRKQIITATVLASCASATTAYAVDVAAGTSVGGTVFFDASYIQLQNEDATGKKVDATPTGTGFDVKRFYLSVDHRFNETWSANLTTDAQFATSSTTTVVTPTGTATALTNGNSSGAVSEVFIKKLYLEGKFADAFVTHIGSYNMPWDPFVEGLYGYRFVEKTITDRLGLSNTTDWGLNASGAVLENGMLGYSASVVNGGGFKNPTRTHGVDFEGRISAKPIEWLTVGAGFYDGHLGQVTSANQGFPTNSARRLDFTVGVNWQGLRVGGEYFNAKNYKTVNNLAGSVYGTSSIVTATGSAPKDDKADGFSTWASYSFTPQYSVFARFDRAKLSKDIAPNLKDTYFNAGFDYKPIKPLDFALVYKYEKVEHGSASISSADANGSYTIGGANGDHDGRFQEVGLYAAWSF